MVPNGPATSAAAEAVDRFDQPIHPGGTVVEFQPGRVIFGLHVARTQTQLEPPAGQRCHTYGFPRGIDRMAQVVVEYECAGAQTF